ncbi:DUF2306 domain-containing protein [Novosphingobium sp. B 225]|uniref:DUF2306 domain-containing protein n=1 Tax=Novosphingobium sp. B 225 TaxID=1961849 RepID=UPI0015959681|nr:DUF2306 domain-containing protein [Novosphingobium sp. B 225]
MFVIVTAFKALRAPLVIDDFPEELLIKAELLPVIFPVHMVTGGLALLLVPGAILLSGRARWHRPVARLAALDVALAGLTAFPVAWVQPVTIASAMGFSAQGLLWLVLLGLGLRSIRRGNRAAHRACMLLMAAATSGAVFFRVYLALFAIYGSYRYYTWFYACDAWLAWGLPVLLTALWLKRTGGFPPKA